MNNYVIKIGLFYIKFIETDSSKISTNFIKEIKLDSDPDYAEKYTIEQAEKMVIMLNELDVNASYEFLERR